jgi:hypothetical protein
MSVASWPVQNCPFKSMQYRNSGILHDYTPSGYSDRARFSYRVRCCVSAGTSQISLISRFDFRQKPVYPVRTEQDGTHP